MQRRRAARMRLWCNDNKDLQQQLTAVLAAPLGAVPLRLPDAETRVERGAAADPVNKIDPAWAPAAGCSLSPSVALSLSAGIFD